MKWRFLFLFHIQQKNQTQTQMESADLREYDVFDEHKRRKMRSDSISSSSSIESNSTCCSSVDEVIRKCDVLVRWPTIPMKMIQQWRSSSLEDKYASLLVMENCAAIDDDAIRQRKEIVRKSSHAEQHRLLNDYLQAYVIIQDLVHEITDYMIEFRTKGARTFQLNDKATKGSVANRIARFVLTTKDMSLVSHDAKTKSVSIQVPDNKTQKTRFSLSLPDSACPALGAKVSDTNLPEDIAMLLCVGDIVVDNRIVRHAVSAKGIGTLALNAMQNDHPKKKMLRAEERQMRTGLTKALKIATLEGTPPAPTSKKSKKEKPHPNITDDKISSLDFTCALTVEKSFVVTQKQGALWMLPLMPTRHCSESIILPGWIVEKLGSVAAVVAYYTCAADPFETLSNVVCKPVKSSARFRELNIKMQLPANHAWCNAVSKTVFGGGKASCILPGSMVLSLFFSLERGQPKIYSAEFTWKQQVNGREAPPKLYLGMSHELVESVFCEQPQGKQNRASELSKSKKQPKIELVVAKTTKRLDDIDVQVEEVSVTLVKVQVPKSVADSLLLE